MNNTHKRFIPLSVLRDLRQRKQRDPLTIPIEERLKWFQTYKKCLKGLGRTCNHHAGHNYPSPLWIGFKTKPANLLTEFMQVSPDETLDEWQTRLSKFHYFQLAPWTAWLAEWKTEHDDFREFNPLIARPMRRY